MRKLISKIKRVVVMAMGVIIALPGKIFAAMAPEEYLSVYTTLYGVPEPKPIEVIWKYARVTVIPLALIVGLIMYFKKSKSSTKKKALVTILTIGIVAIIYCIINLIFKFLLNF